MPSTSRGKDVAAVLARSWRRSPVPLKISAQRVAASVPLLIASGADALCWWRLRDCAEELPSRPREQLRNTYLQTAIRAAKHEREVCAVFALLRSAGIEPILVKGWSVARLYAEPGLRPSGDIDLCVAPQCCATAHALLQSPENQHYWVDLAHDELTRFAGRSFEDLYYRSTLVSLDGTEIRVLSAEDQLRTLCLHFLKHGGWRPIWLCDIAAALESRPSTFDWDRCLGSNPRYRRWILCTISLAQRLLDAELGNAPVEQDLPRWFEAAVLKQWGEPQVSFLLPITKDFAKNWRLPHVLMGNIGKRWPNPVQASVDADRDFDEAPRLPLQIRHCLARARKLVGTQKREAT